MVRLNASEHKVCAKNHKSIGGTNDITLCQETRVLRLTTSGPAVEELLFSTQDENAVEKLRVLPLHPHPSSTILYTAGGVRNFCNGRRA